MLGACFGCCAGDVVGDVHTEEQRACFSSFHPHAVFGPRIGVSSGKEMLRTRLTFCLDRS